MPPPVSSEDAQRLGLKPEHAPRFYRVALAELEAEHLEGHLANAKGKPVKHEDDKTLWTAALEGTDPLAGAALDRFFLSLGAVAGDQALAHGANSVVIAGGLGYRIRDRFAKSGFADRFIAKGRFERRMEAIPVKLVTYPEPGLYGAAAAFAKEFA